MLKPIKGEREAAFLARALSDPSIIEAYPDPTYRHSACVRSFREARFNERYSLGKDLRGAEILEVGEWNGITFEDEDLELIVSSFNALGLSGRVPLKFGHNEEQEVTDGQPALGWVRRVYKQGTKLLADFSDLPAVVYDLIREARYKFVSVELLRNVKADNRTIRWVLDAVSLLGADQPAVGTLKDLQALTLSRMTRFEHGERVTFRRDINHEDTSMTPEEKKEMDDLRRQVTQLTRDGEEKERKMKEQAEAAEKEKLTQRRAAIHQKFEAAVQANKILPRTREKFERIYKTADDRFLTLVTDADIEAFIKDCEPLDKDEIAKLTKDKTGSGKVTTVEVETGTNEHVFTNRVSKEAVAMGFKSTDHVGLHEATKVVMRRDRELARAYLNDPRGEFSPGKKEGEAA